jgi:hypothetical protein
MMYDVCVVVVGMCISSCSGTVVRYTVSSVDAINYGIECCYSIKIMIDKIEEEQTGELLMLTN